jgi:hypothetical protein
MTRSRRTDRDLGDGEPRDPRREALIFDDIRPSDRGFALEAFRTWGLDCHGFRGEGAWQAMADAVCSDTDHMERVVARSGDEPVGLLVVITRPGEFWPLYLSRLGPGPLVRKMIDALVRLVTGPDPAGRRPSGEEMPPVDPEFAALARRSHETTPGVAWGLFGYVDPRYRRPPNALLLYRRMFDRLRRQGFQRLEGQIRFGNDASVAFHRALGFEIRNAGHCLHAVKTLVPGGSDPVPPSGSEGGS